MPRYIIETGGLYAATSDTFAKVMAGSTFTTKAREAMTWDSQELAVQKALMCAERNPATTFNVRNADTLARVATITLWT